jgi:hypothetical protein
MIPIIGDVIKSVTDIISKAVPDADKRLEINLELARLGDEAQARLDAQVTGQIEVNKIEAGSGNLFVSGWRPAVGWVGAAGFGYAGILQPLLSWTATVVFHYKGGIPQVDSNLLLTVLMGMLGIGGMRTLEKIKGVATDNLTDKTPVPVGAVEPSPNSSALVSTTPKKHFHIF